MPKGLAYPILSFVSHGSIACPERQVIRQCQQGNRIRKCGCYLRLTSYELRFIDHVRVAQVLRIMNVGRRVLESHHHDDCLLSFFLMRINDHISQQEHFLR